MSQKTTIPKVMSKDGLDLTQLSDEILFNRYSGGDLQAFDIILKRHKGLLYSLILRYVKSPQQADEIFQEVFLKICKNRDQFREAVSFKSWIVTICRNTCIDHTRRLKRTLVTDSLDDGGDDSDRTLHERIAGDGIQPLDVVAIQVENEELAELLDKLPLEQRETFYMKVISDMTFEEIGAAKKCSVNTAKSRYRYALETLRGLVNRKRLLEQVKMAK